MGVKLIIFDLDSTIMKSKSAKYEPRTERLLETLQKNFRICVMSNNKNKHYIEKVRKISNFEVYGNASKPSTKIIEKFLFENNISPCQTVIIGDRPLTDILSANRLKTYSVLVDSISRCEEPILTRFARKIERIFCNNVDLIR